MSGSMIKDGEVTALIPDGKGMMHVPVGVTKKAVDAELQIRLLAHQQEHSEQARREYIKHHKKVHTPKSPLCEDCSEGKLRKGDGVKGPSAQEAELEVGSI